jgi:AbrB family looped-hinge helix DNA binding protein
MKTKISSKGQIVLPVELREQDAIRAGEQFEVERIQAGQYLLKKVRSARSTGVLEWLQSCPEKGWFRAIPSESTDDL